jgi:hypothetical protein
MHYNLLYSFCLFYVKLCLRMAYLKRPIRIKPGDKVDQDDFNNVVLNSSKNLVRNDFIYSKKIDDDWSISYICLVNRALFCLELSIWKFKQEFFIWKSFILHRSIYCIFWADLIKKKTSIQDVITVKGLLSLDYANGAKAEVTIYFILIYRGSLFH